MNRAVWIFSRNSGTLKPRINSPSSTWASGALYRWPAGGCLHKAKRSCWSLVEENVFGTEKSGSMNREFALAAKDYGRYKDDGLFRGRPVRQPGPTGLMSIPVPEMISGEGRPIPFSSGLASRTRRPGEHADSSSGCWTGRGSTRRGSWWKLTAGAMAGAMNTPPEKLWLSDTSEKPRRRLAGPVEVPAYGVVTLRAEWRP